MQTEGRTAQEQERKETEAEEDERTREKERGATRVARAHTKEVRVTQNTAGVNASGGALSRAAPGRWRAERPHGQGRNYSTDAAAGKEEGQESRKRMSRRKEGPGQGWSCEQHADS